MVPLELNKLVINAADVMLKGYRVVYLHNPFEYPRFPAATTWQILSLRIFGKFEISMDYVENFTLRFLNSATHAIYVRVCVFNKNQVQKMICLPIQLTYANFPTKPIDTVTVILWGWSREEPWELRLFMPQWINPIYGNE